MATYSFRCRVCGYKFDAHNIPSKDRDIYDARCPSCDSKNTKRVMHHCSFSFKEDPDSQVSTKSNRYWENAEKNRLASLDKRRKERAEKVYSNDPDIMAKLRRKAENAERLGKMNQDLSMLEDAKQVRELLGER